MRLHLTLIRLAFFYLLAGMLLGIAMAATGTHALRVRPRVTATQRWHWRLAALTAFFVIAVAVTAALAIPASAPLPDEAGSAAYAQRARQQDRLYFGRERAGGAEVSEAEWTAFMIEVLAPRLREGFTALQAVGAWRDAGGQTRYERSFVVEVVHAARSERDVDVRTVIAEYERRFEQDSVLWVRSDVVASLR